MTATSNKIEPISIEICYKHSPEAVFNAFSNRSAFEKWIAPANEISTRILLHDFKVGGQYRIEFSIPEVGKHYLKGEFVHIAHLKQICFTWVWEEPDIHAGINSLVTADFIEDKTHTKLVITHENLSTLQATSRHNQGWNGTLAQLDNFLSNQTNKKE